MKSRKLPSTRPGFCAGSIYDGRAGAFPCSRKGKYGEAGKWWCHQHQPAKEQARRSEASRKWQEEWDAKQDRWARQERAARDERTLVDSLLHYEPAHLPHNICVLIETVRESRAALPSEEEE